ncbi:hypothetical protein TNCV_4659081 [Trichonephila clavipes]|nr:hypothetical protein TNCV_4659081 [Trichonephila clavipes]
MPNLAPAHFSIALNHHATYPGSELDAADLNPLDFFSWSHLKLFEYETQVATAEDVTARRSSSLQLTSPAHRICLNQRFSNCGSAPLGGGMITLRGARAY